MMEMEKERDKLMSFPCCTKKERESLLPLSASSVLFNFTPTLPLLLCLSSSCRRTPAPGELTPPPPPPVLLVLFCFFFSSSSRLRLEDCCLLSLSLFFFPRSLNAHFLSACNSQSEHRDRRFSPPPCSPWSCQSWRTLRAECKCSREMFNRETAKIS